MNVRPLQIRYVDEGHKAFVRYCNTLRCPLCGGQLDGNIHHKKARLYCVNDNDEYKVSWSPGQFEPDYELISYTYPQYQYVIEYGADYYSKKQTVINRYNMDAHPIHRAKTKVEVFKCNSRISFFRKRLEEDVFLNKLKLYNVFS